jgi:NAD(P)-dependent dehydrogenase (short-subunit alcohol dehydrogenase family)
MKRLEGKTALVTGGSSGLGYAAAERLIAEGARAVIITGTDESRLAQAAAGLGQEAIPVRADVRSLPDLDRLAETARERLDGRLDVLFANAGIGFFGPLEAVDEAFYDSQFDVNVKGLFFTVQKLAPLLGKGSSVVLNASAVNAKGVAGGHVYFATKAAVRSLARTFAAELAPRGVRVNAVSPGYIPTNFQGKMGMPPEASEGFIAMVKAASPLARLGRPEEVAGAVAFLASADSSYITAADLTVDGGFMHV